LEEIEQDGIPGLPRLDVVDQTEDLATVEGRELLVEGVRHD
jgi:hypothetical protein